MLRGFEPIARIYPSSSATAKTPAARQAASTSEKQAILELDLARRLPSRVRARAETGARASRLPAALLQYERYERESFCPDDLGAARHSDGRR